MALINLRDTAQQQGFKVDWDQQQGGVLINGKPVNTQGLINYGDAPAEGYQPNTFYGTQEQIDNILSNYQMKPPTGGTGTPVSGLVGLRDIAEQRGLNIGFDPKQGVLINGIPVDTNGLTNYGQTPPTGYNPDTFYGTQEQIDKVLSPYVVPAGTTPEIDKAREDYQTWASKNYDPELMSSIEAKAKEILTRTFSYDPANDAQFQAAAKELTRNVMETMNARGILNSTITQNQVQQGVSSLLPQYQEIARQQFQDEGKVLMSQMDMLLGMDETNYNRYQDEGERLAEALNLAMEMDDRQFDRWKAAADERRTLAKETIEAEKRADEKKRQDVEDAWDKVNELGYVDNESSLILGVEAGTLSKSAREAKEDLENALTESATKHAQQIAEIARQEEKEIAIIKEKEAASEEPKKKSMNLSEIDKALEFMNQEFMNDPALVGDFITTQMLLAEYGEEAIKTMLAKYGVMYMGNGVFKKFSTVESNSGREAK